jgi:hypothetical protein
LSRISCSLFSFVTACLSSSLIFQARKNHIHKAAPIYMKPVNIWACRYISPEVARNLRPMGSANVQGRTSTTQTMDSAEGNICIPTTSAPTGATVAQNLVGCE